ncbi:MAG: hypothetical protein HY690_00880 [Chloroflexi bacterium]|nr:hypothetical protein [Chloroflexota bacterium]
MAGVGGFVVLITVLFAAPLALGSYVVVQGASRRVVLAWFGFLAALFLVALGLGALVLLTTPL